MFKKILLIAFLFVPGLLIAQEAQKIAYFNYYEVLQAMPEFKQMTDSLQKNADMFKAEMEILRDEHEKKYKAYVEQQETLAESIKVRRQQEIRDLEERAVTFQQQMQQGQEQLQQVLLAPIQEKIMQAVQTVGTENQFAYILEATQLLYTSPQSPDATPLVKKKLGIQ